jgi:drug/metabolite transporter (DMT)-like permease
MNLSRPRIGQSLAVVAAVIWSLTSPGLKFLLEGGAHPLALAFWRDVFIALACVGGLLLFRPADLQVSKRDLVGLAATGAISIGIYHALWVWSISLNGAAIAVVMIYLFPTFVSIGGWLLFREPLRWTQVVALAVSLIGCGLLVRIYDPALFRLSWLGTLVGLLTALTHTVYVLYSQRSVQARSPWTSLTYTMLFGSLTLLVLLGVASVWGSVLGTQAANLDVHGALPVFFVGNSWTPWFVLLVLALGPTLGGYGIFTAALRYIPAQLASLIVVIEAPISTLLAVWLIGEHMEWPQVIGMLLILSAIGVPSLLDRLIVPPVAEAVG